MSNLLINVVNLYQRFLSPDHSFWGKRRFPYGYCRFHPSCSEYFKTSLRQYGFLRGIIKGGARILRCNPLSWGGYDPA